MGYRTDWILRSIGKGEKNEFAAGEAGKFWSDKKGTKYIKENSLKLPKNLKDMLTNLMEKVNFDENKCRKLQTIGIIHSGKFLPCLNCFGHEFIMYSFLTNTFNL